MFVTLTVKTVLFWGCYELLIIDLILIITYYSKFVLLKSQFGITYGFLLVKFTGLQSAIFVGHRRETHNVNMLSARLASSIVRQLPRAATKVNINICYEINRLKLLASALLSPVFLLWKEPVMFIWPDDFQSLWYPM